MTFGPPPIRPELLAAFDAMQATGKAYAFAVLPLVSGTGWSVFTKRKNIHVPIDRHFSTEEDAHAAGTACLATMPQKPI